MPSALRAGQRAPKAFLDFTRQAPRASHNISDLLVARCPYHGARS